MDWRLVSFLMACSSAAAFGFLACGALLDLESVARWRRVLVVRSDAAGRAGPSVQSKGLAACLIEIALRQAPSAAKAQNSVSERRAGNARAVALLERRLLLAGLGGRLSWEDACRTRLLLRVLSGASCLLLGLMFSWQVALACSLLGILVGGRGLDWALDCEADVRKRLVEAHLSEALEVLCLGLRSGLSFDYALKLYCRYFSGLLPDELHRASGEWMSGLKTKDQALRDVAAGYDSAIFLRVVESVIRSMRFGSPLAAELEDLAREARQRHRADVEERVMKAPVKMMLPVGVLILPSMLILVLGPVLLGMANGF